MTLLDFIALLAICIFFYKRINDKFLYQELKINAAIRLIFRKKFAYWNELEKDGEDDPDALKIKYEYQQKTIAEINADLRKAIFEELDGNPKIELFRKLQSLKRNYHDGFFDTSYPWYQLLSRDEINMYERESRELFAKK